MDGETIGEAEKIKQEFVGWKRHISRECKKTMSQHAKSACLLVGVIQSRYIYASEDDDPETNRIFEKFAKTG